MAQQDLIHEITRIAEPLARSLGLVIWGIEIIPSGRTVLRIYVDTPHDAPDAPRKDPDADDSVREADGRGPVIDQCAQISRHVGLALEAEDLLPHAYVLEVSSPGFERPFFTLAQLAPYVGNALELKLDIAQPELPDRKRLRGKLLAVDEHALSLLAYDAPAGTQLAINWNNVRKATLAPTLPFTNLEKNRKKKAAPKANATF